MTILLYTEADEEIQLPTKYELCPRCEGRGTHVNPAIDGNGITGEEMAELGDDFLEDYMSGVYDVACHECRGQRVVEVPDYERMTAAERQAYEHQQDELAQLRAEEEAERRMGA